MSHQFMILFQDYTKNIPIEWSYIIETRQPLDRSCHGVKIKIPVSFQKRCGFFSFVVKNRSCLGSEINPKSKETEAN